MSQNFYIDSCIELNVEYSILESLIFFLKNKQGFKILNGKGSGVLIMMEVFGAEIAEYVSISYTFIMTDGTLFVVCPLQILASYTEKKVNE